MATSDVREAFETWVVANLPADRQGTAYRAVAWQAYRHAHRAGKVAGLREAVRVLSGPHDAHSGMDSYTCGTMIAEIDALAAKEEA